MRKFILFLLFSFILASCKFNPNIQGKGSDALQGVWEEDTVLYEDSLSQYTKHHIKFSCDSFYLTMRTTAKRNINPDTCYSAGSWTEYVKGTYQTKGDTLFLQGTFTKEDFKQKISGCFRIGTYKPVFVIKQGTKGQLLLENLNNHFPILFTLKQRTTCIPKPL